MVFLYIVIYFVLGFLSLGTFVYLNKKSLYFQELFDDTDMDSFIDDSYLDACLTFAFGWPLILTFYIIIIPFHFISYIKDNGWESIEDVMYTISNGLKNIPVVDLSVAELMKEKGFDKETFVYYVVNEHRVWSSSKKLVEKRVYGIDKKKSGNIVNAPILSGALQWLKDEFGYEIGISYEYDNTMKYVWSVYNRFGEKVDDMFDNIISKDCRYKYSKIDAINEAIKYTLMCIDEKKN